MDKYSELVSILLPVCNAESTLEASIQSLLDQSYENIEIIAIDDKSVDNSWKILQSFRKKDKRVKVFRNVKRYGLTITLNRCMSRAKGKFIAFSDARSISTRDRIKRQFNYLERNPKTVAVGTQCLFVNEEQRPIGKSEFPIEHEEIAKTLINGYTMQFDSVLINRYLLPKDLLRFQHLKYPLVYSDIFVKMITYGKLANLNQRLYYRIKNSRSRVESLKNHILPYWKLLFRARFMYNIRFSANSLFAPLRSQF